MSCAVPRELLSRYLDDDLSRTERSDLEEHLERCPDCRAVVGQYRALGAEVAAAVGALPVPTMVVPRRRRRWLPAVAAVVALWVFVLSGGPVVAARLAGKLLGSLEVRVLGEKEDEAFREMFGPGQDRITVPTEAVTLAEAEQRLGRRLLRPTFLPERFVLRDVRLSDGRVRATYGTSQREAISIEQIAAPGEITFHVPEGYVREATVKGVPAMVLMGSYGQFPGEPVTYDPGAGVRVVFEWEGLRVIVAHASLPSPLTADDLVKIADSLE